MKKTNFLRSKYLKLPIVIHIYATFLILFIMIGILYFRFFTRNIVEYVYDECNTRINSTIDSSKYLLESYKKYFEEMTDMSKEDIMNASIFETLSFNEITKDVSIAVLYQNENDDFDIIWPTEKSALNNAKDYVEAISDTYDINSPNADISLINENEFFYYKLKVIAYEDSSTGEPVLSNVYFFYYVPTSNYTSFATTLLNTLFRTTIIALLITGFFCILIAIPLNVSIYKMVGFAKRIAKGNFKNSDFIVVSRELQDLSESMNYMADKLKENDKEQKQFFQNISHELRTPLQSIQGYAEGLKYNVFEGDDKEKAINVIINESERLSSMVENILSISKMDMAKSGNYEVKKSKKRIDELVNHEIENIRGNIILNNKELIQNFNVNNEIVYINENDILRMFDNIFSNCIRYANKNIYFSTVVNNNFVNFTIYDDGPGFDEEIMKNLFVRFAKGSNGKHGIGLSLVKAIVEEHKGTITASNKEGYGACFEISLPCFIPDMQLGDINKNIE